MQLKHALPEIYSQLFPRDLLSLDLIETKATCDACAMDPAKEKGKKKNPVTYQPDLKCCTYEPYLPNFLVGAMLESASTSPSARAELLGKIKERRYSLPIGMTASVKFQVEFNQREPEDFGNRRDWLCPYYNRDLNNCGIWKNRGAVCSTFFCKSSYGTKGMKFWTQLSDYLTYVEMALMEEVLVHLDFSPRQISDCLAYLNRFDADPKETKSHVMDQALAKKLWNGYFDEQEEFFRKCYKMVQTFDRKRFSEALGDQGLDLQEGILDLGQQVVAK